MKKIIVILLLIAVKTTFAQGNIISSNTVIQTCIKDMQCFSINNSSYLFYDDSKQSLYLKVDFKKFKVGDDTIDDWLNDLVDTYLYFKAPFDASNFSGLTNNNHKTYKVNGQALLNGIWHTQAVEITIYQSEGGLLDQNSNKNNFDLYKINFSINILPREYKIHKKPHHLKKSIFIGVSLGRINQLQPGMQGLLGEAYNH
jgi:hypothetical protein